MEKVCFYKTSQLKTAFKTRPPKIFLAKPPFGFLILKLLLVLGTYRLHATIRCFFFFPLLQGLYSSMKIIHFGYAAFPIRVRELLPFIIPLCSLCVEGALFPALAPQAVSHLVLFFCEWFYWIHHPSKVWKKSNLWHFVFCTSLHKRGKEKGIHQCWHIRINNLPLLPSYPLFHPLTLSSPHFPPLPPSSSLFLLLPPSSPLFPPLPPSSPLFPPLHPSSPLFPPVCLSVCLPVCLSVCLFVCLSVCLSVYLSVCLTHQWKHR